MKKFVLLFAALIAVSAYAQKAAEAPERKNWERGDVYGDVKSITFEKYEYQIPLGGYGLVDREVYKFNKSGDVVEHIFAEDEDGITKHKYVYNKNRKVVESVAYDIKGKIVLKVTYTYNEHGKIAEETLYNDYDLKNYIYKLVRSYDDNGLLLGGTYYNNAGDVLEKYSFVYDDNGNRIKELYEDRTSVFEYDDKGNRTTQAIYAIDGKLVEYLQINYTDNGDPIEDLLYDGEGNLCERIVRKYNDAGLQTEGVLYDADGNVLEEISTEYDENGNLIDMLVSRSAGAYQEHRLFTYDEKGREVECKATFAGNGSSGYKFENKYISFYDSHDNLMLIDIYEILSGNEYLTLKEVREIKYRK
ncbi:MAG: RHS repeat protein [Alistipes sp.]|nr:RHS repeat protein [Alistipes sp.]